jgi:hypothetical protein
MRSRCAAGGIASAAGRDYMMTCCVIPCLVPCIMPCWLSYDRQAFAQKYNIEDPYSGTAWLLFCCGCGLCLLCQEHNTMKKFELDGTSSQTGGSTTVVMMPGAPAMGGAPVVVAGQPPRM